MKKSFVGNIIFYIILSVLLIFSILGFSVLLQDALQEKTYEHLSQMATVYSTSFKNKINAQVNNIKAATQYFNAPDNAERAKVLSMIANAGSFDMVSVSDIEGNAVNQEGKSFSNKNAIYFKEAMAGRTAVSNLVQNELTGENGFTICLPILFEGTIKGTVQGFYKRETADELFLGDDYLNESYGYIVDSEGNVIIKGNSKNSLTSASNILDFFAKANFRNGYSFLQLQKDLDTGTPATFYIEYDGEERYASVMPLGINRWNVLSMTTSFSYERDFNGLRLLVIVLVSILCVIFALLFANVFLQINASRKTLDALNRRHYNLLNNMVNGIMTFSLADTPNGVLPDYVNLGFTTVTGYTLESLKQLHNGRFTEIVYYADLDAAFAEYRACTLQNLKFQMQYRLVRRDGRIIWIMDTGYRFVDIDGHEKVQSILTDITETKQKELQLQVSEERFRIAMAHVNSSIFDNMIEADITNDKLITTHLTPDVATAMSRKGKTFTEFILNKAIDEIHPDFKNDYIQLYSKGHIITLYNDGKSSFEFEYRQKEKDDSYRWIKSHNHIYYSEVTNTVRMTSYLKDIENEKCQMATLIHKAETDSLTNLYNKASTTQLISNILQNSKDVLHAFLLLDIDNFKGVNDNLGHIFGDKVLTTAAEHLKEQFRQTDIIGRIGGDEFVVFMPNVVSRENATQKADEIRAIFSNSYAGEEKNYKISCSIGIVFTTGNHSFETLYRNADSALYLAKNKGKDNWQIYEDETLA